MVHNTTLPRSQKHGSRQIILHRIYSTSNHSHPYTNLPYTQATRTQVLLHLESLTSHILLHISHKENTTQTTPCIPTWKEPLENGHEKILLIPICAVVALIGADKRGVRILAVHNREEHLVHV